MGIISYVLGVYQVYQIFKQLQVTASPLSHSKFLERQQHARSRWRYIRLNKLKSHADIPVWGWGAGK